MLKIKFDDLETALESFSDEFGVYSCYNKETGEVVTVFSEELTGDPDDRDLEQDIEEHPERYIRLPGPFEFHEWAHMESFSLEMEDDEIREKLMRAIHGRGAFRNFKDTIHDYGIQDQWYEYRRQAMKSFFIKWCADNELELVDE